MCVDPSSVSGAADGAASTSSSSFDAASSTTAAAGTAGDAFQDALLARFHECLALERQAARAEVDALHESLPAKELERRGLALHRLRILSTETALFGRAQLTLQLSGARPLPPTRLSPGAMATLRPAAAAAAAGSTCTITALRASTLTVTFEELPGEEELAEPLTLSLLHNDVTYRRLDAALSALRAGRLPPASAPLCRALLDGDDGAALSCGPALGATEPLPADQLVNRGLNAGQRLAVQFALERSRPAGPRAPAGSPLQSHWPVTRPGLSRAGGPHPRASRHRQDDGGGGADPAGGGARRAGLRLGPPPPVSRPSLTPLGALPGRCSPRPPRTSPSTTWPSGC